MSTSRDSALSFVERYGATWESWDLPGFVDLFSDDVVYVAHAMQETVVGRRALESYIAKEATEQGEVSVRMGKPLVDGSRVAAEFWVQAKGGTATGSGATFAGCIVARLAPDGRCAIFREYWFDVEGQSEAFEGWGE